MGSRSKGSRAITLDELNRKVESLAARIVHGQKLPSRTWWAENAGRFNNDPIFDDIIALGRKQRKLSNRTKARKTTRAHS